MQVRPLTPADLTAWVQMRHALWPDETAQELAREAEAHLRGEGLLETVLLADAGPNEILGMIEISLRPYAEGCRTTPVAYVEGWYVAAQARRRGIGRALVAAAEHWAREQRCSEIASDAVIGNRVSESAHLALGFEEVERAIHFRKSLSSDTNRAP